MFNLFLIVQHLLSSYILMKICVDDVTFYFASIVLEH